MHTRTLPLVLAFLMLIASPALAQQKRNLPDKFRQLEEILPTANDYRTASGAPGHAYWQQRADYSIDVRLDDEKQRIEGKESIRYRNNSPDTLRYLWLQLDNNSFDPKAIGTLSDRAPSFDKLKYEALERLLLESNFSGALKITRVVDEEGDALKYTIVATMMRIDLPEPLAPGDTTGFSVDWNYNVNDAKVLGGRTGFEYFPKDKNYIYEIAHWFPRMAAYTDSTGWQHKQFVGAGEFTLEFGDYDVRITVPDDHIVAATGVLQNAADVLTSQQRDRLEQAASAKKPVLIVTPSEAKANEKEKAKGTKTWHYSAENVRDFAFASSRKFIWDAQRHSVGGNSVLAMSYYPNEGNPLWQQYSTEAIIHTLNVYSRYSFDYPYPIAISVNGPVGGMEYPMICFNGPRPEEDGTYTSRTKYGLISVVIHEVGHNYFPMVVNSDEREWTWMDEGINTFIQSLAEEEWEKDYPSNRGKAKEIVEYMRSTDQVSVMTSSDSLVQFGPNAYRKPAAALNVLRDTVLGRELFDFAFREYATRWKFKRPQPADFFRSIEDASGTDLDWFWRGWFYSIDHVDISLESVRQFNVDTRDPETEKALKKNERDARPRTTTQQRNESLPKRLDKVEGLRDFYNEYDELNVTAKDRDDYKKLVEKLTDKEKELLRNGLNFYVADFRNVGGVVMPILMKIDYTDGSSEEMQLPAEIWRLNGETASRMILTSKEIRSIVIDPRIETADADTANNSFPRQPVKTRFQLFKEDKEKNPMQEKDAAVKPN